MTYRPAEEFFGPPWSQRLPSFLYVFLAVVVTALVLGVEFGARNGKLYQYFFVDRHLISAHVLVILVCASAVSSFLRAGMRGVRVRADFLEYRDMVASLWPKVRRIRWAQIDQINLEPSGRVSLDLWDGSRDFLPGVAEASALSHVLERVARARAIPWRGVSHLDDLEDDEPSEGEDA
jgi:hypothetical protein